MNTESMRSRMEFLRQKGMLAELDACMNSTEPPTAEQLSCLNRFLEAQENYVRNNKFIRELKSANLKYPSASKQDINFDKRRNLNKTTFMPFFDFEWVRRCQHMIFTGPCGVGKTKLANVLGVEALKVGIAVKQWRFTLLLEMLEMKRAEGDLYKFRSQLAKIRLLIIDDWCSCPVSALQATQLLEIFEGRAGSGSIILTSQASIAEWHAMLGGNNVADAVLDRVVHYAHHFNLTGTSRRKYLGEKDVKQFVKSGSDM